MLISKYKVKDTTKQLEKYEENLGCKFPDQYRQFIVEYNGGELWDTTLNIENFGNSIEYFYGFVKASEYHSINNKYVKDIQKEFLTPQQVLGIAELGGGDVLAVGISENNRGMMYYSNHDEGYKVTKIADSFKNLLNVIESTPIDKSSLEHPEDIIRIQSQKLGKEINEKTIAVYWKQYNDLLNLEQEEVIID